MVPLATPTDPPPPRPALVAAGYLSLLLVAIAVFAPTLAGQFVWDDGEQVRDNDRIRHWSSFVDFWRKDILELSRKSGQFHSNYYRPLFYVQYLLYYKAFGLNAVAWHVLAILHHWLASAAVLLLLRRLRFTFEVAWMAALLFVVHPAHGESVSWIAAAFNDPPAATCLLLGLAAHATWYLTGRLRYAPLCVLGYAGALCLKESGLSMLLLVPLVEWYLYRGLSRELVASLRQGSGGGVMLTVGEKKKPGGPADAALAYARLRTPAYDTWIARAERYAPYLALTVLYFAVRRLTLGFAFGHYEGTAPISELAPTFPMLALFYLRLLLWPFGLAPSYPLRYVPDWGSPLAWGSLMGLVVIVGVLFAATWRRRVLQLCCLWVICCIWPVFNIRSFLPTYLAHQRYLYLASLAVCLAVAWILAQALQQPRVRRGVLAAICILWAYCNLNGNSAWCTDHALWTRICESDPHNPAGFDWLANEAMQARDFARAESLYRQSIAADKDSPYCYQGLAILRHRKLGRPAEALAWYDKALAVFAARGHSSEVEEALQCRINKGACLAELGRNDEALRIFLTVSETPPFPPMAAANAAFLLRQTKQMDRVEALLTRALSRHPADAQLLQMMIDVCLMKRRPDEARSYAERLARVSPNDPAARDQLNRLRQAAPHR